jgi:bifunctional DNA-binding transcriptional regulator/antitoxin component of YhaV-PrlF toxin-antitoxin module
MVQPVSGAPKLTAQLSTKGQLILRAKIRRRRNRGVGTRLTVEETQDGILLTAAPLFPPPTPAQVFGCLRYQGEPKTLQEMRDGIAVEVRRRHARGRY